MNTRIIKYAPLAADALLSIYERISNKKDSKLKEAELDKLLIENMTALSQENKLLKAKTKRLMILTISSLVIGGISLILHFV